jgi:hypothetical protein
MTTDATAKRRDAMADARMAWQRILVAAASLPLSAVAADPPGAMPGDDAMTCQQIAMELQPYMQQMRPSFEALAATGTDLKDRGNKRMAEQTPAMAAFLAAMAASHADPTGTAGRAVGQAEGAYTRSQFERALAEDKPLADKYNAQANQAVTQSQQLQSNERLQRLLQLVRSKHCDKPR